MEWRPVWSVRARLTLWYTAVLLGAGDVLRELD
jgi:hypothetical protein